MEWRHGDYVLSDDRNRIGLDAVMELLGSSDWAKDRPRAVMAKAMEHSVCLGLLLGNGLVGFARGVTDHATFTWVCDVVVHPAHRGRGLGKWMMRCYLEHPELQAASFHLRTKEAHGLYEQLGFRRVETMRRSTRPE